MESKLCEAKNILIFKVDTLSAKEIGELCQAAKETIANNMSFSLGFNYANIPEEELLRRYFLGALLVPEREQFICKLNNVVAGYLELLRPSNNQVTKKFSAEVTNHFVAPWARESGIAKKMLIFAEYTAKKNGISVLKLAVRDSLVEAKNLYTNSGYHQWGSCDKYEKIGDQYMTGHFFYKELEDV